jgi:23S rRNA pseudouridine2605 synthase
MEERIQKILSAAGIASRRAAEEIILEGRVRVNGKVVSELGAKADPDRDHIKVDGKLINPKQPKAYIMLNKPAGFVTAMSDPEGRPIVANLLKGVRVRVYPVGRLDYDTEGLLLLTNDGDLAHLVTHPKHELPKTYLVKVKGFLEDRHVEMLEQGVFLKDGKTAPARVRKLRKEESNSWVEITIHEGRKRQVRRMIDHTGHSVIKLKRTRVGSLSLGDLPVGMYRHLTLDEVQGLRQMAMQDEAKQPAPRIMAPMKSMEARSMAVRRGTGEAQKLVSGRNDGAMWGRGEEKRRSRGQLLRKVTSVKDGSVRRTASVERSREVPVPRAPFVEAAKTGERGPSRGPIEQLQGKQNDRMARGAGADRRPRVEGARKPPFRGQRSEERPRWSEQRGTSGGPARPSGDRSRPTGSAMGRQRPDARGVRAGRESAGSGEKRTARPAFGGKVSGTREGGSSGRPSRPSGDRARPASFTTGRPRPDAQGARSGSSGTGFGEKRTIRPAFGGKVYGTRKRGPVSASGPRPGGLKRTGPKTSGPRPGSTRSPRSRRP